LVFSAGESAPLAVTDLGSACMDDNMFAMFGRNKKSAIKVIRIKSRMRMLRRRETPLKSFSITLTYDFYFSIAV
jgi:hypothetical protein